MEKYTINKNLGFFKLPIFLTATNEDLNRESIKENIRQNKLNSIISNITDYELTAFRPKYDNIIYDIYFHHQIDTVNDPNIRNILSLPYRSHYDQMVQYFTGALPVVIQESPVPIGDIEPITAFPSFWNSFCYPFYNKKDTDWYDLNTEELLPKRFAHKSYLYNSFIKITYYTTPNSRTQETLFQDVIYVNNRWSDLEGDENGSWIRPTFNINESTDGYFLYWLKNYNIDKIYVKFEFWDALNGRMISLIPTSSSTKNKQWVQSVNYGCAFNSNFLYLEYDISYEHKTYDSFEYNCLTKKWDISSQHIKLYEIIFSDYFYVRNPNIFVNNGIYLAPSEPIGFYNVNSGWLRKTNINIYEKNDYLSIVVDDESPHTFYNLRYKLDNEISELSDFSPNRSRYKQTNVIINQSEHDVYLKNIIVTLEDDTNSTLRGTRLMSQENYAVNELNYYRFYAVPNPSISTQNGLLQPNFAYYYKPERAIASHPFFGYTTTDREEANVLNWADSSRSKSTFYPINVARLLEYGRDFSEHLIIRHVGDKMTPIPSKGTLNLDLFFSLGKYYSIVYIEPRFYDICDQIIDFVSEYRVDMKYLVKLVFNNKMGTLSELNNTIEFYVNANYLMKYRYKVIKPVKEP